jgi:hypothetical protein
VVSRAGAGVGQAGGTIKGWGWRRVGRRQDRGLKVGGGGRVGEAKVEEGATGEVWDDNSVL